MDQSPVGRDGGQAEPQSVTVVLPYETANPQHNLRVGNAADLANAFSEFIAASARLENSYRQLQDEVTALRLELGVQNEALTRSLAQNRRMRLHLQQIVDSMPCGVLVIDQDGNVSMMNPESVRLLAWNDALLHDQRPMSLAGISTASGMNLEAWYRSSTAGEAIQEFCVHDTSGNRWIEVRNRRLIPEESNESESRGNEAAQTIFILRDITAQRRDEQERTAGRKAMALAEMTTILAHEIRNPLASLELFAELIENDPAHREAWISNLRAGIRSLSAMANNVLSFHGSGALHLVPLPLSTLMEKAIEFVQPLADQASVSLEWTGAHDQGVVMGNDSALQQVVLNLVSNAIRHTPAGGKVTISMRRARKSGARQDYRKSCEELIVEFADSGCGIRPDQAQHIFEPGFSGSGDRSGMGLAVCRQIMRQHNGAITVAPYSPGGACFLLHFPLLALEVAIA